MYGPLSDCFSLRTQVEIGTYVQQEILKSGGHVRHLPSGFRGEEVPRVGEVSGQLLPLLPPPEQSQAETPDIPY